MALPYRDGRALTVGAEPAYRAPPPARYADAVIAEVLEVEGVHCPRCIQKIAAALADVDGLLAADANLMGEISVRLDGPEASERVQAALANAGFPVAAVRPAD
jgi:copper chaperone CopZ